MAVRFINALKNKHFAIHQRFLFQKDRKFENKTYWKCFCHKISKARLILEDDEFFKNGSHLHYHEPSSNEIAVILFKNTIIRKSEVKSSYTSYKNVQISEQYVF